MKTPKPKNKDGLIEKYYHLDVFDTDHFVLIGDHSLLKNWSKDVLKGERQEEFVSMLSDTDTVSRGRMYPMKGGGSIIWLKPGEHTKYLVHEITHAVSHVFRAKGMPICDETDELLAYMVERLYERFI